MAKNIEPRVPEGIDITRPSIARIYDYLLFGKDNFAVDRQAAEKLMQSKMDPRQLSLANRAFLVRAVDYMASHGVTQFLDLGSGLPTSPSVHQVAREIAPDARVVYVDHDPIVVVHNDALLATNDGVVTMRGDVREPDEILDSELAGRILDFSKPLGVLLLSVLHFVSDDEDPPGIIARIRARLAPGSYLAITSGTCDGADPDMFSEVAGTYSGARMPFTLRTMDQINGLFNGFDIVSPGVVSLPEWRPGPGTDTTPLKAPTVGGLGLLRS